MHYTIVVVSKYSHLPTSLASEQSEYRRLSCQTGCIEMSKMGRETTQTIKSGVLVITMLAVLTNTTTPALAWLKRHIEGEKVIVEVILARPIINMD